MRAEELSLRSSKCARHPIVEPCLRGQSIGITVPPYDVCGCDLPSFEVQSKKPMTLQDQTAPVVVSHGVPPRPYNRIMVIHGIEVSATTQTPFSIITLGIGFPEYYIL